MSKAILVGTLATMGLVATVQTYNIDQAHSSIGFKARHLGIINVNGKFTEYEASVTVDPEDLSTLKAEAVIQVGSVDTGIERRDNHLRSGDFFNAEAYPTITFVSKEVRNINGSEFELVGDLTIRETTQEIVLQAELTGSATMGGTQVLAFEAEARLNRFDYGLQWDALTEAGGLIVGEEVRLILELEAAAQ